MKIIFNVFLKEIILLIPDGAFSIETRLELAGVAGPVRQAGSMYNLQRKGGPVGGVSVAFPMLKSVSLRRKTWTNY